MKSFIKKVYKTNINNSAIRHFVISKKKKKASLPPVCFYEIMFVRQPASCLQPGTFGAFLFFILWIEDIFKMYFKG